MSDVLRVGESRIEVVRGDITEQEVDAIVNAANSHLAGGGGVDGAIHDRGGPEIMRETRRRYPEGCPTGSAVITGAGDLPAQYVIHAVGPRWRGGGHGEEELLRGAYRRSLELASEASVRSVAFPAISAGAYGYPGNQAADVAIDETHRFLASSERAPLVVRFCIFTPDLLAAFQEALAARRKRD